MYVIFNISIHCTCFVSPWRGNNMMLNDKCKKVTLYTKYLNNWTLKLKKKSLIYKQLSELLTINYFQKLFYYYFFMWVALNSYDNITSSNINHLYLYHMHVYRVVFFSLVFEPCLGFLIVTLQFAYQNMLSKLYHLPHWVMRVVPIIIHKKITPISGQVH